MDSYLTLSFPYGAVTKVPILAGLSQGVWDSSDSDQPLEHMGGVVPSYNGLFGSVMEGTPSV